MTADATQGAPAHSENTLPVGTRVGEFEIKGVIGEGGFGTVYLAFDLSLHRTVALKEYLPSALAARSGGNTVIVRSDRHKETFDAGMRSFINEARLLARFDHPALVKVYRFWEDNQTAYMAMPYYEGETLKQLVKRAPEAVNEAWLKAMLAPLLDSLEALHEARIYHRDISPDNIMIQANGAPVLLDFGAARRIIGDMTQALTVILKPGYAPIEQYADDPGMKQGPWSDLYALAAVLYFAITKKAPPTSVTRIINDPLQPLAQQPELAAYDRGFLAAIDAALVVRPEGRMQSVAAFREALGLHTYAPQRAGDRFTSSIATTEQRAALARETGLAEVTTIPNPVPPPAPVAPQPKQPAAQSAPQAPAQPPAMPPAPAAAAQVVPTPPPVLEEEVPPPVERLAPQPPPENRIQSAPAEKPAPEPRKNPPPAAQKAAARGAAPAGKRVGRNTKELLGDDTILQPDTITQPDMSWTPPPSRRGLSAGVLLGGFGLLLGAGALAYFLLFSGTEDAAPIVEGAPVTAGAETTTSVEAVPAVPPVSTETPAATPPAPVAPPPVDEAQLAWEAIQSSQKIQDFRDYLTKHPASPRAEDARKRVEELVKREGVPGLDAATGLAAADPEAAPLPPGTVRVTVKPWGYVTVDGVRRGASPPLKSLRLPEGKHVIQIDNPAFPSFTAEVEVKSGQQQSLVHSFQ